MIEEVQKYSNLEEIVWCQEEPLNQGAWYYLAPHMFRIFGPQADGQPRVTKARVVDPVARPSSAAPATGLPSIHLRQQRELVAGGLGVSVDQLK